MKSPEEQLAPYKKAKQMQNVPLHESKFGVEANSLELRLPQERIFEERKKYTFNARPSVMNVIDEMAAKRGMKRSPFIEFLVEELAREELAKNEKN
ncbi:hypothetical protein EQG49_13505 [Periweissella cryptocerci]|uniref:Ribbon-helix-helix protein, CopG family n=1 Tax=Periweissella cryptocerci TaxID=2506420 RepID=A0A4P6YX30_9LACO|nr:hypothetical protein [Periweissella cryptocerci]QBO37414.1 hypothetical protein EQG49_13505 [Periweissella cryptocerci]